MITKTSLILFLLFHVLLIPASPQCCTKTVPNSNKCSQCPTGYHLWRGSCIIDVDGCSTYGDGFECVGCRGGLVFKNGGCEAVPTVPTVPTGPTIDQDLKNKIIKAVQATYKQLSDSEIAADPAFKTFDAQAKSNTDQLGNNPTFIMVFSRTKGTNVEYILVYRSSINNTIYSLQGIYSKLRRLSVPVSFGPLKI